VTRVLAEFAADIPFLFFSSDLVFDGRKGNYDETAAVNPLSVYAQTKVEAEKIVLANPKHTVVRTSLNGGLSLKGDRGFNEQTRKAWESGKTLTLFTDEFRCPISAAVTARAMWELAGRNQPGLYHLAGSEPRPLNRTASCRALANTGTPPPVPPPIIGAPLRHFPERPNPTNLSFPARLNHWPDAHG
jgi:dTDP-4-dehydrorhamnose reductase